MDRLQYRFISSIGPLYLVASETGLQGIYWGKQNIPFTKKLGGTGKASIILGRAVAELEEYLAGKRKSFRIPLDFSTGTPFQKKVWNQLRKIPHGKTVSYLDIAREIKHAKSSRAVGTANAKNPLCIIVPCHRVIASDGSLGGYSGGLKLKSKLLALENQYR
jgi:methylated-DNA-[protein]-cysteine S-methyltransferase